VVKKAQFFGKNCTKLYGNCAKMAIVICYINGAKCILEALLV